VSANLNSNGAYRNLNYILISRRSRLNAGVKLIKKGLDLNGNSANFLETEQIVIIGENIFSFVQMRGAPPIVFDTDIVQEFFEIVKHHGDNNKRSRMNVSFDKHVHHQLLKSNFYEYTFLVNLMNISKNNEQTATNVLEQVILSKECKYLKYMFLEYAKETRTSDFTNLEKEPFKVADVSDDKFLDEEIENFLKKIEGIITMFKYFGIYNDRDHNGKKLSIHNHINYEDNHSKTFADQIGVIRTCCYDGLETTNTIQMRIAGKIFLYQLEEIGIDTLVSFGKSFTSFIENVESFYLNQGHEIENISNNSTQVKATNKIQNLQDSIFTQNNNPIDGIILDLKNINISPGKNLVKSPQKFIRHSFLDSFKQIWNENGIKISEQYEGGLGVTSANFDQQYIVKQNMKQRCLDIFLQKFEPAFIKSKLMNFLFLSTGNSGLIQKEVGKLAHDYTTKEELKIFVGTWNVGGQTLNKYISLVDFLLPKSQQKSTPDLYFIGLQEIVVLSANYVLISSNQSKVEYWGTTIINNLDKIDR
jgi:hypothetical protein